MCSLRFAAIASLLLINFTCAAVTREDVVPVIERVAFSKMAKLYADDEDVHWKPEADTVRHLQSLGPDAIPYLLPLLKHQNKVVRRMASTTLAGMEGLREEHLDALFESRLKGDYQIPPAIARVGTSKAIEFLVDELKKEKTAYFFGNALFWDTAPRRIHTTRREGSPLPYSCHQERSS